jgi:DNA-binding LytR/AlgR family response regulator
MKTKVLVVDDELIIAASITKSLNKLGYELLESTTSAEDALSIIHNDLVNIVLMDINLNGSIDGIQAADIIKTKFNIPVIFITAMSDYGTLERAKITEPYGYIVKPYNIETLQAAIELALFNHQKKNTIIEQVQTAQHTLSCLEEGVISTALDLSIELINKKAAQLTGIPITTKASHYNLRDIVYFYSKDDNKTIKLPLLDSVKEVHKKNIVCYFLQTNLKQEHSLSIHPIVLENTIIGWTFVFDHSTDHSASLQRENAPNLIHYNNTPPVKHLFPKKGNKHVRIDITDILWLEALDNYVIIHAVKDKYVIYSSLKNMEYLLPSEDFLKVHRSFIVRLDKVDAWEDGSLIVSGKSIAVSKSYKDTVKEKLLLL